MLVIDGITIESFMVLISGIDGINSSSMTVLIVALVVLPNIS